MSPGASHEPANPPQGEWKDFPPHNESAPVVHHHVTTRWLRPGYEGRFDCALCGFSMLGENRALEIKHNHRSGRPKKICDGCVNAIGSQADGMEIMMGGEARNIRRN